MIESVQPVQNVREIKPAKDKLKGWGGLWSNSWLRKVYRRYLKRYAVIRWVVMWVWCNAYPFCINLSTHLFNIKARRWRPLIKLSDFTLKKEVLSYKLADSVIVETPLPTVFPLCDQSYLLSPHHRYKFPEIFVATIKNAMIYGGTNLILTNDKVICHDLYDFKHDYISEEFHGRALIDPKSNCIRWLLHDELPEPISVAASFVDSCAANYAHWMTEVLPRIVIFCAEDRFHGVPIVVNHGLHKNLMESLLLVTGSEREIITLPIGRALAIDKLYLTSATGYVPFGMRVAKNSDRHHGIFSPYALELLRNSIYALGSISEAQYSPEKIYLRRNSGARKATNSIEIEKLMLSRGYAIIEPEKLTFSQQVQLFKNAKIIIAPTGAALASAVFSKPATQVVILMAKHENMIYRYWSNMLLPIKVSYVLGSIVENQRLGIHGDFVVNINDLIDLLETLENK